MQYMHYYVIFVPYKITMNITQMPEKNSTSIFLF